MRGFIYFGIMFLAIALVGVLQSWNVAFAILNLCLISGIMALGVNIQWGYAGLFNVGIMGFSALGGATAMLIATKPVGEAWSVGGVGVLLSILVILATIGRPKRLPWRSGPADHPCVGCGRRCGCRCRMGCW